MKNSAKILIIEDETSINRLIELSLIQEGFQNIYKLFDGKNAINKISEIIPDLILLDVMLPELDGISICKLLKKDEILKKIPVIMITAKQMEDDILKGFEAGAIDYITKPFSTKILLARIKAHLKNNLLPILKYKDITLNTEERNLYIHDKQIKLTTFEFEILSLFLSNIGIVFSRTQLLEHLRGYNSFNISPRAIDVQIVNLRKKLADMGKNIETIYGAGYKLKDI